MAQPAPLGPTGRQPGAQDGVCANITFPFPGTLVSGALARATGNDPKADPWMPERAVWPLMEVVEEHFDEPWLAPLADHIRNAGATPDPAAPGKPEAPERFSASDTSPTSSIATPCTGPTWCKVGPGHSAARRGRVAIRAVAAPARPHRPAEPGGAPGEACARLRDDHDLLDHPDRLSLFGLTRLPASYLQVLDAIAGRPRGPPLSSPSVARALGTPRAARRPRDQTSATAPGPHGSASAQPAAGVMGPRCPRDAARSRRRRDTR